MDNNTFVPHCIDTFVNANIVKGVFYIVTIIVGFFGNILIISTILKNKYLRTPMNISLVSLAFCDMIVCACVLPVRLFLYSGTCGAPYMMVLCRLDVFLKSVCDYVQPSMLVATSFERYKSIAKPLENKGKVKRIVTVISVTWCTCLCCGAISAVLFRDGATYLPCNKSYTYVYIDAFALNYREGYVTFPFGLSCIVLVCIFYYFMIKTLHDHSNKMKKRFKAKPFQNKVKPTSIKRGAKVIKMNTFPTEPTILENKSIATDSSRQQSATDILFSKSSKSTLDPPHVAPEQNRHLLQVQDVLHRDSQSVSVDSNSKFQNVSYEDEPRRISIRKTRDSIFVPPNESKKLQRLSVVAKHVMLLKSHKKRSLNNMQNKRLGKVAVTAVTNTSADLQENCTSKHIDSNCDGSNKFNTVIETDAELIPSQETEQLSSDTLPRSPPDLQISFSKNDSDITTSDLCDSLKEEQTEPRKRLHDASSCSTHSETFTDNNSNTSRTYSTESHCKDINEDNKCTPSVFLNVIDEKHSDRNVEICETSKNNFVDSERNSKNVNEKGDDSFIKDDNVGVKDSAHVSDGDNKEKIKSDTGSAADKPRISNIDIVDFDGTVYKGVKVEGAVVGAVCVMNTTNRLEGRRKVEMRAAKRIAVMIGSFVLLWLPLPLIALFVSSRRQISSSDIEALLVSASISSTTVAFNPILNLLLNKQLRSAATSILRRAVNVLKRMRLH